MSLSASEIQKIVEENKRLKKEKEDFVFALSLVDTKLKEINNILAPFREELNFDQNSSSGKDSAELLPLKNLSNNNKNNPVEQEHHYGFTPKSSPASASIFESQNSSANELFQSGVDSLFDYNTYFQMLLEKEVTSDEERLEVLSEMAQLFSQFKIDATQSGKKIIEMTPQQRDSIKIDKGVAGGEKFKMGGIFFKLAVDHKGLYGGDSAAQKVAGHELRSLSELTNLRISGLNLPMVCIIDFLGHRVLASSILPVDQSTLVYGSSDGGKNLINLADEGTKKVMKQIGISLNIKPHLWGSDMIDTAIDVEFHRGKDGRVYCIDAARLWPPTFIPSVDPDSTVFYNFFRPEFLKNYNSPLNPDTFSRLGKKNPHLQEDNVEVELASKELQSTACQNFAQHLKGKTTLINSPEKLVTELHRAGINIRYLPLVKKHLSSFNDRGIIALIDIELLARSFKSYVQQRWRKDSAAVSRRSSAASSVNTSPDNSFLELGSPKASKPPPSPRGDPKKRMDKKKSAVFSLFNPKKEKKSMKKSTSFSVESTAALSDKMPFLKSSLSFLEEHQLPTTVLTDTLLAFFSNSPSEHKVIPAILETQKEKYSYTCEIHGCTAIARNYGEVFFKRIQQFLQFSGSFGVLSKDPNRFVLQCTLSPKIKSFPFKPNSELFEIYESEGITTLEKRKEGLLKKYASMSKLDPDSSSPVFFNIFESLGSFSSLLAFAQDLADDSQYSKAYLYLSQAAEFLQQAIYNADKNGMPLNYTLQRSFEISSLYSRMCHKTASLDESKSLINPPRSCQYFPVDRLGLISLAVFYLDAALKRKKQRLRHNQIWIAKSLTQLGSLIFQDDHSLALRCIAKAITILEEFPVSEVQNHLAACYNALRENVETPSFRTFLTAKIKALPKPNYHLKAIALQKTLHGDNHPDLGLAYLKAAHWLIGQQEYAEAHRNLKEGARIMRSLFPSSNHTNNLTADLLFVYLNYRKGDFQASFTSLRTLIPNLKREGHSDYLSALFMFANISLFMNERNLFQETFKRLSLLLYEKKTRKSDILMLSLRDQFYLDDSIISKLTSWSVWKIEKDHGKFKYVINDSGFAIYREIQLFEYKAGSHLTRISLQPPTDPSSNEATSKQLIPQEEFIREWKLLEKLTHPCLAHYLGITQEDLLYDPNLNTTSGSLFIIFDYFDYQKPLSTNIPSLPPHIKAEISNQLADLLSYLHSNKVVVFGLTSSDIYLQRNGDFKVASLQYAQPEKEKKVALPSLDFWKTRALPPEFDDFRKKKQLDTHLAQQIDVFNLGCILWELIENIPMTISNPKLEYAPIPPVTKESSVSPAFLDLVNSCLDENPEDRPSCKMVLEQLRKIPTCFHQKTNLFSSSLKKFLKSPRLEISGEEEYELILRKEDQPETLVSEIRTLFPKKLHQVVSKAPFPLLEEMAKQSPEDINAQDEQGKTPLFGACLAGRTEIAKFLLRMGADANIPTEDGLLPLHVLAQCDNPELTDLIISKTNNLDFTTTQGLTPLYCGCSAGNFDYCKRLFDAGAKINNEELLAAAEKGSEVLVSFLLSKGAQINAQNSFGETAFFLAARGGHVPVLRYLVQHKASTSTPNHENITPLQIAEQRGRKQVVEYLQHI